MSRAIPLPRREGLVTRQAHADLPKGTFERELGRDGFFGPAAHIYHRHAPTSWISIEGAVRPRALDTTRIDAAANCPWESRRLVSNPHVEIGTWQLEASMEHLVRNADGDQMLFVHQGSADLFCDFGHMAITEGDYVLLPRGTLWRFECNVPINFLLIEATAARYRLPDRGPLGAHAQFDPAVLDTPELDEQFFAQQDECEWTVRVKARGGISTITYPFNPLDAVGWKGDLAPVRLNWRDIRPVVSPRYHLPPSAHSTFVADRFVICTFCPRPLETDPGAMQTPFFHSNIDYDEVIFYHRGQFISRQGIGPGALSLHPAGCTHGPHPEALAAAMRRENSETNEVAVMIDTLDALELSDAARSVEVDGYAELWSPQ